MNLYWPIYKNLEQKLLELSEFIHFQMIKRTCILCPLAIYLFVGQSKSNPSQKSFINSLEEI